MEVKICEGNREILQENICQGNSENLQVNIS